MRPVLIGQAPGPNPILSAGLRESEGLHRREALFPFGNSSGNRLARHLGLTPEEFDEAFDRVNVLSHWPGKTGKGDKFDRKMARRAAKKLASDLKGRDAVLLGKFVGGSFGLDVSKVVRADSKHGVNFLIIPHPSGINQWWNRGDNAAIARKAVYDFF